MTTQKIVLQVQDLLYDASWHSVKANANFIDDVMLDLESAGYEVYRDDELTDEIKFLNVPTTIYLSTIQEIHELLNEDEEYYQNIYPLNPTE